MKQKIAIVGLALTLLSPLQSKAGILLTATGAGVTAGVILSATGAASSAIGIYGIAEDYFFGDYWQVPVFLGAGLAMLVMDQSQSPLDALKQELAKTFPKIEPNTVGLVVDTAARNAKPTQDQGVEQLLLTLSQAESNAFVTNAKPELAQHMTKLVRLFE